MRKYYNVGRDGSVGMATRYGLGGPGIESCRSQWPSGLRGGSAVDRLLGLRFRISPKAWMFVLCAINKEKRQNAGQSRQKIQVRTKHRVNVNTKNSNVGEIFRTRLDWPWGPRILLYNGYRISFPEIKRLGRSIDHSPPSNA